VKRAEPFHGIFPQMDLPVAASSQVHKRYAASLNAARMVLAGYEHNINEVNFLPFFLLFVHSLHPKKCVILSLSLSNHASLTKIIIEKVPIFMRPNKYN
jgi:hypothetical protein